MNSTFRAPRLANSEVISQVLFTSEQPKKNKMAFVGILSQIKFLFDPLFIQLVWYILKQLFRKSRHKPNPESTSKYGFSPDLGGKNSGVFSMRMQVILDSLFARPGLAPIVDGKKGEFRDWTTRVSVYNASLRSQ